MFFLATTKRGKMAKILGYILAVIGVIGIAAWAVPEVRSAIPNMGQLGDTPLIIASAALLIVGIFLIIRSGGGRQRKEVPIFQGKNVVGYRRH